MKKKLYVLLAVLALVVGTGLEARRGGGHRGGRGGGFRRHGGHGGGYRRHGGWGRGWGRPGIGFGISVGSPGYYGPGPVAYLDDPYDWYWTRNPRANWDAYVRWLELNSYRIRGPWRSYYGSRYRRRWGRRPGIGIGFGIGF